LEKNKVRIHLGGHLAYYHRQKQSWLEYALPAPVLLCQIIEEIGVPPGEVALFIVNGEIVDLGSAIVQDEDTIHLYPPIDGG
jgi:sulfur carrier protein ThiS